MFYNHNDQLTRTTIRAILLEISKSTPPFTQSRTLV